ncbi:MAG: DNA repair protein RecO [Phycisphaerae bacterium]|nr:DNA repair protein RecO [Phycisphaerae bacterium]
MPPVQDQAVCVRVWDWSETSQTVTLFARGLGLVRAMAKGSKRPPSARSGGAGSAFSGGVETLSRGECWIFVKPSVELATLARWDLVETFPALRKDLGAHNVGLFMSEVVLRFAADRDPHPDLYDAMVAALRAVGPASTRDAVLARFLWSALESAGYRPVLDRLPGVAEGAGGEVGLPNASAFDFDPNAGALVGVRNPGDGERRDAGRPVAWAIRRETILTLAALAGGADAGAVDGRSARRGARFLAHHARHVLGSQFRMLDLVFSDPPARGAGGTSPEGGGEDRRGVGGG